MCVQSDEEEEGQIEGKLGAAAAVTNVEVNSLHKKCDDFDYTTVPNAEHTTAQSYNSAGASVNASVDASVNASVAGSKQYKHIAHPTP